MTRLPSRVVRAGLVGGALGVVAAGAALGVAVERGLGTRRRSRRRAAAGLASPPGETRAVLADDGVALHVEVDELGPAGGLTVVFCHAYGMTSDAFVFQRRHLHRHPELARRLVLFDARGHGRSARGPREHATIDQLGRDLRTVLDDTAPDGPVVLVGHSLGGMTVMALADRAPELFGHRVTGVALLSTSPGSLAEVTLGVPAALGRRLHRLAPHVVGALGRQAALAERGRRVGGELEYLLTRRYAFASPVPPEVAELTASMLAATPVEVLAELFPAFDAHDKLAALPVLARVETLLLCGEDDLVTPVEHTRGMRHAIPDAELVVVPRAGHMVLLEHPDVVNAALEKLLLRASGAS